RIPFELDTVSRSTAMSVRAPVKPSAIVAGDTLELGRFKRARRAYGFDEVALVPGRVTINPQEVDSAFELGSLRLAVPILAAAMDGVVDVRFAVAMGRLGGMAIINLDGLQTRYVDPRTALELMQTGITGILVGVGPGAACTTRGVLGVGVPQVTATSDVAAARETYLQETGRRVQVITDGGMRVGGDIAKAFASGA